MSDIEQALAEALKIIPVPSTYEEWQARVDASYEDDARTLLATEPMQAIAREAARADALAVKVDALNERCRLLLDAKNHWMERAEVLARDAAAWRAVRRGYKAGYGYIYNIERDEMMSLEAIDPAIAAALGDDDEAAP